MRIVQLTDTHVVPEPGQQLHGVDTYRALERALERALALDPAPDAILVTGDLTEDGSRKSYLRCKELFSRSSLPVLVVPGNHDDDEVMRSVFHGSSIQVGGTAQLGDWFAVLVNSQVMHRSHGEIRDVEWTNVVNGLEAARGRPTLVAMHHPPVPACPSSGCQLKGSTSFVNRLSSHPNVKVVVSGHLHQQVASRHGQMVFLTTPSTFAQVTHPDAGSTADVEDFWASHSLTATQQGFRTLDLFAEGRFETSVHLYESPPEREVSG